MDSTEVLSEPENKTYPKTDEENDLSTFAVRSETDGKALGLGTLILIEGLQ